MPDPEAAPGARYEVGNVGSGAVVQQGENLYHVTVQLQDARGAEALVRELRALGEPALPAGTVTLLAAAIDNDARLWEDQPERMRAAVARFHALLAECLRAHRGILAASSGSAIAVFARAERALAAAGDLQRRMQNEVWPTDQPLRARVALHSGEPEQSGGSYYGPAVNRCVRLRDVAHGGQILLSEAVCALVCDHLPAEARLQDLGAHRLPDLQRPEAIFALALPGLPAEFPPLRSLDALPTNLAPQLTSFVGREGDLAEVKQLLSGTRLLTLLGPGGCGKTRLALQAGADLLGQYKDGVWLVDLAPLRDPALLAQAVAAILGAGEEPGRPLLETLAAHLKPKSLLLILDNCEHLVAACARFSLELLRACPHLRILATSREALDVAPEVVQRVLSLSLPEIGADPSELMRSEAARLFVARAFSRRPGFAVTEQNAPAIAQICVRLDGIPLALELAAARVRVLKVEQIAERLGDRFRLLTDGDRMALPQHRTLRALMDWSYDLLSAPEQTLLQRISVFAGGWTLPSAEVVCADAENIESWEVLDLLSSLVDKSLVVVEEEGTGEGEARYRLLETVRAYAAGKLEDSGEALAVRRRHRDWFLQWAERADAALSGAEQRRWRAQLDAEHDNLRAALHLSLDRGSGGADAVAGLRLAAALARFWDLRGYFTEGRRWLSEALSAPGGESSDAADARAEALSASGGLAHRQGDYARARALFEETLAIRRALNQPAGVAQALRSMGQVATEQGDYARARALLEESLALYHRAGDAGEETTIHELLAHVAYCQGDYSFARASVERAVDALRQRGDDAAVARALCNLGLIARAQDDPASARTRLEESLTLFRTLGDRFGVAVALTNLGEVARIGGDLPAARAYLEEALETHRDLENRVGIAYALVGLGQVARGEGDDAAAAPLLREGLALRWDIGDKGGIAACLEELADIARRGGQPDRAARLFAHAAALRAAIGAPLPPAARSSVEQGVAAVRAALGGDAFARAESEGRALSLEDAVALARE